jgi:hypothetical protein
VVRAGCSRGGLLSLEQRLKHDNLVQLFAVCTIGEPIFIITELCCNGSLLDYLRSPAGEALRLPTLIDMATDIASGMVRGVCIGAARYNPPPASFFFGGGAHYRDGWDWIWAGRPTWTRTTTSIAI